MHLSFFDETTAKAMEEKLKILNKKPLLEIINNVTATPEKTENIKKLLVSKFTPQSNYQNE